MYVSLVSRPKKEELSYLSTVLTGTTLTLINTLHSVCPKWYNIMDLQQLVYSDRYSKHIEHNIINSLNILSTISGAI